MITEYIINTTARCPRPDKQCEGINVGKPVGVVEKEEGVFTLYKCENCGVGWHRPHNPLPEEDKLQTV